MVLDFTGIENIEFYSAHYLEAILEGDLKSLFARWAEREEEKGIRAPFKALPGLGAQWERAKKQAADTREPEARWRAARSFHAELVQALGFDYEPTTAKLDDGTLLPLLVEVRRDGRPYLWIADAGFAATEEDEALDDVLRRWHYPASVGGADVSVLPLSPIARRASNYITWREALDRVVFRQEQSPRWVLFLTGDEVYLAERHKWPSGRLLRFDLGDLLVRKEPKALRALCALIHRDSLAPEDGGCLHDSLEESSHKHASAVSSDLKYGVRRAVELLANEAIHCRKEVQKKVVHQDEEIAAKLKDDCLTYLYRLLFLFYVEARGGELGVVPMQSDAYREGYSLETLRDLELVPLTTEKARNGYYLDHSLKLLFRLVDRGFAGVAEDADLSNTGLETVMDIPPLRAPLFDDSRLRFLGGLKFRNSVLQEVLALLSLSKEEKRKKRGRISYAQLGINQLGAVYEGLLSYSGFFAAENLYEVAPVADCRRLSEAAPAQREMLAADPKVQVYFVPESELDQYADDEIVKDTDGRRLVHRKGSFLFRLAGRNREKSASYYTPEVLTQCVVKYALKELLEEPAEPGEPPQRKLRADEILGLSLCEPAMGSGAFLIEAVDQLADAYLVAKQEELDRKIPAEDYQEEKRRVKARLATNNCYGVDLNPTAVELAKVSLWLATLRQGGKCPWFGLRLAAGNSLVGARREVFAVADLTRAGKKDHPNWLGLVPERVPLHSEGAGVDESWRLPPRPAGTVYHFLLPDEGMAASGQDKIVKQFAKADADRLRAWKKAFTKPFSAAEVQRLERLSDAADRLWAAVVRERHLASSETTDRIPVWPDAPPKGRAEGEAGALQVRDQEAVAAALEDSSSAYRRLRLVMDAWCALWFWPVEASAQLPDRKEWLASLELVLLGRAATPEVVVQPHFWEATPSPAEEPAPASDSARLLRLKELSRAFAERRGADADSCGLADVETIIRESPWLATVERVRKEQGFHHWPLRFAEVFAERGGFDLILGNPPWIRITWQEGDLLSEFEPLLALRKQSASNIAKERARLLEGSELCQAFFGEFVETEGIQAFLSAQQNEPLLRGMHTNLYKCFITRAWSVGSARGVAGFLHPEGVYDDPKGGALRRELYPRLALHAQFQNVFSLFDTNDHGLLKFGINVYGVAGGSRRFSVTMSNVFHPRTLDTSFGHDGHGEVPGIKLDGSWDLRGHRSRLVTVDEDTLALFATLYDKPGTDPLEARLPVVHSEEIVQVLRRFAEQPRKLGDLKGEYFADGMFHETESQKDRTIRRDDQKRSVQPASTDQWILQGPHFHVGTPFNKTPNEVCASNGAWTSLDLTAIPDDYLPRTNYVPACDPAEYLARTPKWNGKPVTGFYRHVHRRFVSPTGERTLAAALFPPGPGHVNVVSSTVSTDLTFLTLLCGITSALPADFLIKTTGTGNLYDSVLQVVPLPEKHRLENELAGRVLNLNCLTAEYSALWSEVSRSRVATSRAVLPDSRICSQVLDERRATVLRTDLERRNALVEIDVLTSLMIGIDLDQLSLLYRVQFPVLQQYERERRYDQHGRIVPTSTTAAGQPAVSLVKLGELLKEQAGFDVARSYLPGDPDAEALLTQRVRLARREAEVLGVSQRCLVGDLMATTTVRYWDDGPDGTPAPTEGRPVELLGLRYTDPGLEPRMERVYPTPWTRCDREEDYRVAWAEFEHRLGKQDSGGTGS